MRLLVAAAALALGVTASQAASHAQTTTRVTVVAKEFKFTLSRRSAPVGTVIFTVTNKGKLAHDFKIAGKKTPKLAPGRSATLQVAFSASGTYPYLSTLSGQASKGMKGVFTVTDATTPTPSGSFASGLYYVVPAAENLGGTLTLLGGALNATFAMKGNTGWALNHNELVWIGGGDNTIHVVSPAGVDKSVKVQSGLFAAGRPTLSPDGTKVAVQATESDPTGQQFPRFLTIYVITLATGAWTRLVAPSSDPATGNELPEWNPVDASTIAHQGIRADPASPDGGSCDVFPFVDATTGAVKLTIKNDGTTGCYRPARKVLDGPRFQITFTADGKKLLVVGQMRTYDAASGVLVGDIHDKVLAALSAAGYAPDDRFPGQGGGGTFPLDGTFSPDGTQIVFDGAVQKAGSYGVLLMRINTDGTGFTILAGPLTVTPMFSNNHNYSQLNPYWLP